MQNKNPPPGGFFYNQRNLFNQRESAVQTKDEQRATSRKNIPPSDHPDEGIHRDERRESTTIIN